MKNLIIANWKLNPASEKEAKNIFSKVAKEAKKIKSVETVICPPFVFLPFLKGLPLGAQNVFWEEKGAFTGEISPLMLKDLGVKYVILGHSERRKYFNENNQEINKKIKKSLQAKLNIIFCIGETEEEKNLNRKSEVLEKQIKEGLGGVSKEDLKFFSMAYEPVWAIGTGNNCSVDETMKSILLIRKIISDLYNRELADKLRILYGGSVKGDNSGPYIKEAGADGLLVGGASLKPEEFIKIIKSAV